MVYKYLMTQRPPMLGAMPMNGLEDIQEFSSPDRVPEYGRRVYAVLNYSRKLTDLEVYDYELAPVQ